MQVTLLHFVIIKSQQSIVTRINSTQSCQLNDGPGLTILQCNHPGIHEQ